MAGESYKKAETVVLSVGGSLIVPKDGINTDFLKKLDIFIRKQIKERRRRFLIVIGGGSTARQYRDAGKNVVGTMTDEDLDWLGIHATRLNAHLVRTIFQDIAHPRVITNYDRKLWNWYEPIAIGAGWKPGWSTDYCAAVLARDYKASVIINLSNIDYVYDKDPSKFHDAQIIKKTTWSFFENIVGTEWVPGTNAPFDPVASQLAKRHNMMVIVANGKNFRNLNKILNGEDFKGTVITNYDITHDYFDENYYRRKEYKISLSSSTISRYVQKVVNMYRALWIKLTINPKNCLDIGCGTGLLVYYLRKLGVQAYGVDVSGYAVSAASREIQPFLQKADLRKLPYDNDEFELVVSMDVLEHLGRDQLKEAVNESIRVSRKLILHKIYTIENSWINLVHGHDVSQVSILSQAFWYNMFRSIENVSIVQKFMFKLPTFFESVFVLRKKTV